MIYALVGGPRDGQTITMAPGYRKVQFPTTTCGKGDSCDCHKPTVQVYQLDPKTNTLEWVATPCGECPQDCERRKHQGAR